MFEHCKLVRWHDAKCDPHEKAGAHGHMTRKRSRTTLIQKTHGTQNKRCCGQKNQIVVNDDAGRGWNGRSERGNVMTTNASSEERCDDTKEYPKAEVEDEK